MQVRDRIRELRRVPASQLRPSPKNWRSHPKAQQDALRGVLAEVGYADALLAREDTDGTLVLIDGHLRAETTPDMEVPVLILDVTEAEADKILLTLDPLAAMATADAAKLDALLRDVQTGSEALVNMLTDLHEQFSPLPPALTEQVEEASDEPEDALDLLFKAPFPWFGGKSRVAKKVWKRFGDIKGYIEPFFGSGACLLNRPQPVEGTETINDFDGLLCNFWRAVQGDPTAVAQWCDWPINENDLTARHAWLVGKKDSLQARMEGDPDYFDAKIAGWWCWGMALWIGSGFCAGHGPWRVVESEDGSRQFVQIGGEGQGIHRKRIQIVGEGRGIHRKLVHIGGKGQGIHRQLVQEGQEYGKAGLGECGLQAWMQALSERLRRVRVCCGDWTRVCGGKEGDALGHFFAGGDTCGIFLDPPYADTADRHPNLYRVDSLRVAHAVREWAIAHGDDPRLRIALCGYEGEHQLPDSWQCVSWKACGGMASIGKADNSKGKINKYRERVWFSPHCLKP